MSHSPNWILLPHSAPELFESDAGGKAKNIARLHRMGLPVPSWICVGKAAFEHFAKFNRFDSLLSAPQHAQELRDRILESPFPEDLRNQILDALRFSGISLDSPLAIRSSGLDEDSAEHSFAGQFESYLFQTGEEALFRSIRKCWASAYSDRVSTYRAGRKIQDSGVKMGVLIQLMIDSDSAGVAFSRNPMTPLQRDSLIIQSIWGQGEGLVSGEFNADTFEIHRDTFEELKSDFAKKDRKRVRAPDGGLILAEVEENLQEIASLSSNHLRDLAKILVKLEADLGCPQDVEWAVHQDQLYLLQTRPITSLPSEAFYDKTIGGDRPILWDNSNIIESFCGVTTPLTFTHVSRAYRQVYLQFCEFMGVPASIIAEHEPMFRNMLGLVRGRIYYNLGNWYRMIFLFPGSATNKGFMETMMGVKQGLKPEVSHLFDFASNPPKYSPLQRIRVLGSILFKVLRVRKLVNQFKSDVDQTYLPAKKLDFGTLSFQQQIEYYSFLEREFLFRWKAPIVSDTRCMIFFGILKKLTHKWIDSSENTSLQNDLLCGQGDLPSTEPTRWLIRIAAAIEESSHELKSLFLNSPSEKIWEAVSQPGSRSRLLGGQAFWDEFQRYLECYGFRSVNELKFEEPDLFMDPTLALDAIASYLRSGKTSVAEMEKKERAIRERAEAKVRQKIHGIQLKVFEYFVRQARSAVKDREDLRFLRTNTFGITRRLFLGMGDRLSRMGVITHPRDVFYLTIDELIAYSEGRSLVLDFKAQIEIRKAEFEQYRKTPSPPDRFLTQGPASSIFRYTQVLSSSDLLAAETPHSTDSASPLRGIPCCPGVVEGVVRVVRSPADAQGLNGEILVAERTDPGWIPLFPSCSGLLIERGSALSHSAVVAREMGIPTLVGVSGGLLQKLKTGMKVRMNASTGVIEIL